MGSITLMANNIQAGIFELSLTPSEKHVDAANNTEFATCVTNQEVTGLQGMQLG